MTEQDLVGGLLEWCCRRRHSIESAVAPPPAAAWLPYLPGATGFCSLWSWLPLSVASRLAAAATMATYATGQCCKTPSTETGHSSTSYAPNAMTP